MCLLGEVKWSAAGTIPSTLERTTKLQLHFLVWKENPVTEADVSRTNCRVSRRWAVKGTKCQLRRSVATAQAVYHCYQRGEGGAATRCFHKITTASILSLWQQRSKNNSKTISLCGTCCLISSQQENNAPEILGSIFRSSRYYSTARQPAKPEREVVQRIGNTICNIIPLFTQGLVERRGGWKERYLFTRCLYGRCRSFKTESIIRDLDLSHHIFWYSDWLCDFT